MVQKVKNFDLVFDYYYSKDLVKGCFLIVVLAQNTMIVWYLKIFSLEYQL